MTAQRAPETEVLWRDFRDRMLSYIRRRVRSAEDAEDILQEVFLRVHGNAEHLAEVGNIAGWLYRVARNAIIDHLRKRATGIGSLAELPSEPADNEASLPPNPEVGSGGVESSTELSRCMEPLLERLPQDYREAVRATELNGLTQKEAAAQAGVSLSGMKARVQRGRSKLKNLLLDCCAVELDGRQGVIDYQRRGDDDPCGCDCS